MQRKFDKNDTRDTRTELFKGTLSFPVTAARARDGGAETEFVVLPGIRLP